MAQFNQSNKALTLNMDKGVKYLSPTECFFLLNNEIKLNQNGSKRGSLGMSTPMVGNYPLCEIEFASGENYRVGNCDSPLTNESYAFTYNNNGIHFISRITGTGDCEIVYHGCLNLSAKPSAAIEQFRAKLVVEKICKNRHGKYLVWCDGNNDEIGYLDVDASIATNFFTTPFFDRCPDPCAYVQLCVPQPCECLHAEYVPLPANEVSLTNHLVDNSFKFIYRFWYYDGRKSEWSDISSLYFQDIKGCFDSSSGASRCLKLRLPIGNPMVEKIEVGFNKGDKNTETQTDIWLSTEVIEKYKKYNSSQQYWYERDLSELITSPDAEFEDCSFWYFFCNDKQCQPIDIQEVTRLYNPIPRKPQGFIQIKNSLGFYNYEQGNCPLDKSEVDKFSIAPVYTENSCATEYATVTVRTVIHNFQHNRNQFIYRLGGGDDAPDDVTDTAYFGGLNPELSGFETGYDQNFNNKVRNFIAYIEGTAYYGEMQQMKAHAFFTTLENWGTVSNMDDANTRNRWRRAARHGEFFYQELKIKVKKGTKGFLRLSSQHATGNEQKTSTFVVGILDNIYAYKGDGISSYDSGTEEIYFDTCAGDFTTDKAFLIQDNAVRDDLNRASAYYGYIKDNNGRIVEGADIYVNLPVFGDVLVSRTDHNGFYHFYLHPGTNDEVTFNIKTENDCGVFTTIKSFVAQSAKGFNTSVDAVIDSAPYSNGFYATVKMKVDDCNGNGIGGIRVALSGSKYHVTNGFGIAEFRIRNYSTRDRVATAVVMDTNGCFTLDCSSNCNPCMPSATDTTPACYQTLPTVTLASARLNVDAAISNKKGLKAGGNYPFAFMVQGDCGKISAAYELPSINIKKTQDKTNISFPTFTYDGTGMVFPFDGCLKILRGVNLNPFELQWVIDKIERTTDNKIKLTIQSLNDYNAKYFFKTNTIYQWQKNDRIEFIKNGDDSVFLTATNGLLNYLTISPFNDEAVSGVKSVDDANFFNQLLIEDDGKLDGLTEGAVIELQRSKECVTEPAYFGICANIPIVNGTLLYPTGTFTTFDTYLVSRTITYTSKKDNKTIVLPSQIFEHHSPSDFWGSHLDDTGKPHFINKYENQRRYGRNISINSPTQFNFFGNLIKTFDAPEQGDIIAMDIKDAQIILAIGEHDNFLAQASDNLLRVGSDNIIRAASADSIISDAQPKVSGQYGCQYPHIGSIFFGDGYALWVDLNNGGYIKHDYNMAKDVSEGKTHTWFKRRCQEIETWNRTHTNPLDQFRFATGQNKTTNAIQLTLKALRHSGINNEIEPFLKPNETILFDTKSEDFLTFVSYTYEGYSNINLFDGKGCSFIGYLNGIPYIFPIIPDTWNKFSDFPCDWVVGISLNKYPEKIKIAKAMEIESETAFYVKKVTTDKPTFISEIPAVKVKKTERKWNAAFLNDKNSRGGLFNGNPPRGYAISVTMIRDNTLNLAYNSIDNLKRVAYSELDMVIMKAEFSEQSGFENNL